MVASIAARGPSSRWLVAVAVIDLAWASLGLFLNAFLLASAPAMLKLTPFGGTHPETTLAKVSLAEQIVSPPLNVCLLLCGIHLFRRDPRARRYARIWAAGMLLLTPIDLWLTGEQLKWNLVFLLPFAALLLLPTLAWSVLHLVVPRSLAWRNHVA